MRIERQEYLTLQPEDVTNGEFLQGIFGEHWATAHITGFDDDPSNITKERRAACWSGGYAATFGISIGWNNYFTISQFEPDANNKARRRKSLFLATYVIVADDVKEKLPVEQVEKLPLPSYKLLTSPGSEQWGWILNTPCSDMDAVNNLLDGLVEKGLAPSGTDPGMKGVTRYVRLPQGVNTKGSRVEANGGTAPRCQLLEWHPERRHAIETLSAPFSIDLTAERHDARSGGATNLPDHPILQIPDIIHVKKMLSLGRYDITCPWTSEHTGTADDGAAVFTNDDGTIGFKCHHGSCEIRNRKDLMEYIEQRQEGFGNKLHMYELQIKFQDVEEITVTPLQLQRAQSLGQVVEDRASSDTNAQLPVGVHNPSAPPPPSCSETMQISPEKIKSVVELAASWDPIFYDSQRKDIAKKLGIRVSTLDEEVAATRKAHVTEEQTTMFPKIEIWEQPINGCDVLDEIENLISQFIVCSEETRIAITLWIVMTWFVSGIDICPLAVITAPEKRCGKTILLSFIAKLAYRAMMASNISPAALFRSIDEWNPTLLIDEADAFMRENEELRGIINSGHTRDSAFVIRVVGDDHIPTQFNTFGPKAIAGIGRLPDTVMDRGIILPLRRKLPHEKVERLRHADPHIFTQLRMKLARFSDDHNDEINLSTLELPESLNDRAQDNWEPLLAIADAAGGEWPRKAREAALILSGSEEVVTTVGVDLLRDIKDIFKSQKIDRIRSTTLISYLCNDTQKRWNTYNRGKPLSARQLSTRLSEYGIKSRDLRFDASVLKGYLWTDFEDVCGRYLPVEEKENLDNISFL